MADKPTPKRRSAVVPASNKLDEISAAIGEIRAYVHEFRHGTNNLATLIKASELASEKRHVTLKVELKAELRESIESVRTDLASIASRVAKLEEQRHRQDGAISAWKWLADHWPFAALAVILSTIILWANGKIHG